MKKTNQKTKVRASLENSPAAASLDRIDRAILRSLQKDASISNVALAHKVHLSPAACLRRVERLKAMGLVQRIVAAYESYKPRATPRVGARDEKA